jgi:hypothetical protein
MFKILLGLTATVLAVDKKISFDVGLPLTKLWKQANDEVPYYNILAMDGGGIRGLIPAQVTDYLETALYEYA